MTAVARRRFETVGVLGIVYMICVAVLASTRGRTPQVISAAVMFDLIVTSSLVVWWLGVRRGALSWRAVTLTATAGLAITRAVVPAPPWTLVFVASIALECAALAFVVTRVKTIVRAARPVRARGPIVALETGLRAVHVPPRIASFVAGEVGVSWLALTGWFRRRGPGVLTMHRRASWFAVCGVLIVLVASETAALHLLIAMWSMTAAWIATALSIYSVLWLVGDAHALRLYGIVRDASHLHVALGVRWRVSVPLDAIETVEPITTVPEGAVSLAVFEPSVLVTLRDAVTVHGLLGRTRTATRIALTVDEPAALRTTVAVASGRLD